MRNFPLVDPTDYVAILRNLRAHLQDICEAAPQAQFFIAVASGTPQMHACWVLLAASGEIPARLLHVRPPRFVSRDSPLVSEVDLTSPDFPLVRANVGVVEASDFAPPDIITAVQYSGIVGDHPAMRKALEVGATLAHRPCQCSFLGRREQAKNFLLVLFTAQWSTSRPLRSAQLRSYS